MIYLRENLIAVLKRTNTNGPHQFLRQKQKQLSRKMEFKLVGRTASTSCTRLIRSYPKFKKMAVAVALRNLPLRPVARSSPSRSRTSNIPSYPASFFSKSLFPISSPPLYIERFPSLQLRRATGEFDQVCYSSI